MIFNRIFAMPSADTFSVKPIGEFVWRYLAESQRSIDPFARNKQWATRTNDLNPDTEAEFHLDAEVFCNLMGFTEEPFDLGIFDPPYSPRQISECYKSVGREVGMTGTQNAALYKRCRDALHEIISPKGIVLSFGWSSNGMGKMRGYEIVEILLVAHGGGAQRHYLHGGAKTMIDSGKIHCGGTPQYDGVYVCYLPGLEFPTVVRTFVVNVGWCNNLREQVTGPVAGWIGPLPAFPSNTVDAIMAAKKPKLEFDL